MIMLNVTIQKSCHKNLINKLMSVISSKIGEYMARRIILMNQKTGLYLKDIYIDLTTMCHY